MNLSPSFTLEEAIVSETAARLGIDNTPTRATTEVLGTTARRLEIVRSLTAHPIHINSWYRSPELNAAVGSAPTSQHILGEAVDWICPRFSTPLGLCKMLMQYMEQVKWDQLILEHTWVHISFCANPTAVPRGHVLSLLNTGKYATGLTDMKGNPL